jgi:hypothetical protein
MSRVALLLVLLVTVPAWGQTPALARSKETLVQKLLRIAGLTAAPSQVRGPGDMQPGDVWIAEVDRRAAPRQLTQGGMYRSPIFAPRESVLCALRDDTVVRIALADGAEREQARVQHAVKLVGFTDPTELVILVDPPAAASPLVTLSLTTGRVTPLPFDARSGEERRLVAFARAAERVYGDTRLYTRTESKRGLARTVEWTDVFVARGAATPVNVSACDGEDCGGPALSPDGRHVAYVRARR